MAKLITTANLARQDDVYQALIDLHADCDETISHKRNAKLILTLANHIGEENVLFEAVALVRENENAQKDI